MTLANLMPAKTETTAPSFLQNGGATGALLRQIDWTKHPLGPPERWPVILRTMIGVVLDARQPMLVCWGPDHHTLYNDAYAEICGPRHPAALAAPLLDSWHDIRDVVEPMLVRVFAGESIHMDDIALDLHENGVIREAHYTFSYTPLRSADTGNVLGVFCVLTETTNAVMLRRELAHERARLGQIFELSPGFIAQLSGPDHVYEMVNPAYLQLIGHRDIIGKSVIDALPEIESQGMGDLLDEFFASGTGKRIDGLKVALQRVPGGALEDRYLDFVFQPMLNSAGAVTGIFAEGVDVTDRTMALAALQANEQFLRSVLGTSPDCVKVLDLEGRVTYINDGGRLLLELPDEEEILSQMWPSFWKDAGNEQAVTALASARTGSSTAFQGYAATFTGTAKYWDVRVTPMLDAAGQPERILTVSRDISYLKQVENEREHLMQELSHRLRNAFGMVHSPFVGWKVADRRSRRPEKADLEVF